MNSLFRLLQASLFVCAFITASAFGDTFDFSYVFGDGISASGEFDGTYIFGGKAIGDISNVSLSLNGNPISGPVYVGHFDFLSAQDVAGGAQVSVSGAFNNFFFVNSDWFNGDAFTWTGFLSSVTNGPSSYFAYAATNDAKIFSVDVAENSSWSVTEHSVSESGSSLALCCGAFAALALLRRRFAGEQK